MGWFGAAALAMGGSNQSLFLLGALLVGQGDIPGQGTAAIPLLVIGLLLSFMAAPGWTELVLMWPDRVGGLAATCGEAFRPYAPVLGNLTGVCYWWGWVPTCGVTALLSASALQQWFLPGVPVAPLACVIVLTFTAVNLCGVWWPARLAMPIATVSATLAFVSALGPVVAGTVDWRVASDITLHTPFPGVFGAVTSAMAGLYLVGFAAPAFEASLCHVGEMVDPGRSVPRAMLASGGMAALFFGVLPLVWLGSLGPTALSGDLAVTLAPTFAPVLGSLAKSAAVWFMTFNMFHGTLAPLTGVARTLSQLSEDGLLPRVFAHRNRFDCPWVAITITATCAILFLLAGDPVWLIAAADFTYLIGISLPSVAVWLLRRDRPDMPRPYRAPRGFIALGLVSACAWAWATVLGFEQFGLPTVLFGLFLAYSGAALYAWRRFFDARAAGHRGLPRWLHIKLSGAMLLVLALDGAGYYLAVTNAQTAEPQIVAALQDIFVVVAMLTLTVGLVLPGMIAHSAEQVSAGASRLAGGTLADFSLAMEALGSGDLDNAHARVDIVPVTVTSHDELGAMADSFNLMQDEVARAAASLGRAREGLRAARAQLQEANATLELRVVERTAELEAAHLRLVALAHQAGMAEVAVGVLHNVGNVLNSLNVSATIVQETVRHSRVRDLARVNGLLAAHGTDVPGFLKDDPRGAEIPGYLRQLSNHLDVERERLLEELGALRQNVEHIRRIVRDQQVHARSAHDVREMLIPGDIADEALRINRLELDRASARVHRSYDTTTAERLDKHRILQVLVNLVRNAALALEAGPGVSRDLVVRISRLTGPDRLVFEVADTGVGITADQLPRIFESGYTTRTGGTGFGLSASASAVAEIGGTLTATSDGTGRGATFTVGLPLGREAT